MSSRRKPITEVPHDEKKQDLAELLEGNTQFNKSLSDNTDERQRVEKLGREGQKPTYFVISCSDARAPPETIFRTSVGLIFVQRDIANEFRGDDCNAALEYALKRLGPDDPVKHVVVLGHTGCGGVEAAMKPDGGNSESDCDDPINSWISPIKKLYQISPDKDISIFRDKQKENKPTTSSEKTSAWRALVKENIKFGMAQISQTTVMKKAWRNHPEMRIYGLMYDIQKLDVTVLCSVNHEEK